MAPVGACLRRAGAQGVKGTCGPGIQRALGAAHSIPAPPSPRPSSRSAYLPTYLPRAYVSRFFFRAAASPPPRSNSRPPAGVFELAFFPRVCFSRISQPRTTHVAYDFAESSRGRGGGDLKISRSSRISLGYYSLSVETPD